MTVQRGTIHNNAKKRNINKACFWQTETYSHPIFRSPDSSLRIVIKDFPLIVPQLTKVYSYKMPQLIATTETVVLRCQKVKD